MLQDTSTAAYDSIRDKLNEKQRKVRYVLMKFGPLTDQQIAEHLEWPINCVTGRRGELVEMGVVLDAGYATAKTGRKVHVWKLKYEPPKVEPAPQLKLI